MRWRFQFSSKNLLLATTFLAWWCAACAVGNDVIAEVRGPWVFATIWFVRFFQIAMPAAALGALRSQAGFGLACGTASTVGLLAWQYLFF